jgi:radical SAM protein (TIGR01212 family)
VKPEKKRYNPLSGHLRRKFGTRVSKIPVHAGMTCPNRDGTKGRGGCIFCNNRHLMPGDFIEGTGVEEQIEAGLHRGRSRAAGEKYIIYFQSFSNTHAPIGRLREMFSPALPHADVAGISIGTRPDCLGEDVISLLAEMNKSKPVCVELGLQSGSEETLRRVNRGHGVGEFLDSVRRLKAAGIETVAHVMIGFPWETRKDVLQTARICAQSGVDGVKIHSLHVDEGTDMERMFLKGELRLPSLEEYASLVVDFLEMLPERVVVHRLTGEGRRPITMAPEWTFRKQEVIRRIEKELEVRDTWQGGKHGVV